MPLSGQLSMAIDRWAVMTLEVKRHLLAMQCAVLEMSLQGKDKDVCPRVLTLDLSVPRIASCKCTVLTCATRRRGCRQSPQRLGCGGPGKRHPGRSSCGERKRGKRRDTGRPQARC
eukprot:3358421-Rhodomonas_salina.5